MTISVDQVLGVWQVVSFTAEGADGATTLPFGEPVDGRLIYTPDGHMSAQISGPDGYLGYAGTYQWLGDGVVHRTVFARPPEWSGAELPRSATLTDDRLTLITPPDADGARLVVVWRRPL